MNDINSVAGPGAPVVHARHGQGMVMMTDRDTTVARFAHGIEQVFTSELRLVTSVENAVERLELAPSLEVGLRVQAEAAVSVNDAWGVFTRSRITLLPHQLWVCHRALRHWPIRLLIADDVGMGKTIEAGLLLWPLLASRKVQRALIMAPAKLVGQWQSRLKQMFDIRAAVYHTDLDTERADFWGIHSIVIASLPTLRADRQGRHDRLVDAAAWDMVIVDEAHHLNAEQESGKTLGFELLEKLQAAGKVTSCVLFTGTPHRGKNYGFWSLMSLLNADLFGPKKNESAMLAALPNYLIRNAKQKATDMTGKPLFMPVQQFPETFHYSPPEEEFYERMSEFIVAGKAYATSLGKQEGGRVVLVLIALQKLASSSIAAVVAALKTRQTRLASEARRTRTELATGFGVDESDSMPEFEVWLRAEKRERLQLVEDEERYLGDLLAAGEAVGDETRVRRIVEVIKSRFPDEPVLLFTEYKRTQALVIGALTAEFGPDCVGFMNGDNRLEGVRLPNGRTTTMSARREDTCDAFNAGRLRFLVSTEAGGEGIDLQQRCSALIHVDLPWNPMRLHQRVGRLNRYGQIKPVKVVSLRNPDTVEAMIWGKLEDKLNSIMRALGSAMDEPEDLMQLVLGMSGDGLFEQLFAGAASVRPEKLDVWFDQTCGTLGGISAIQAVRDLVGHAESFDLSALKDVPPVDLPDLLPFFQNILALNQRRPKPGEYALSFKTPEQWLTSHAIRRSYDKVVFDRLIQPGGGDLMGVGHPLMEKAFQQAALLGGAFCLVRGLAAPLLVIHLTRRVTDHSASSMRVLAGISGNGGRLAILRDWQVLREVNQCAMNGKVPANVADNVREAATEWLAAAILAIPDQLSEIGMHYDAVLVQETALLWPAMRDRGELETSG